VEVTTNAQSVGRKTLKKGDIFQDLGIDGKILLKCILSRMGSWRNIETSDDAGNFFDSCKTVKSLAGTVQH